MSSSSPRQDDTEAKEDEDGEDDNMEDNTEQETEQEIAERKLKEREDEIRKLEEKRKLL